MHVKEIMSTQVQRIHQNACVSEAAEKMKAVDVGMIPVYDGDRLVGTLTDRDIVTRAIAQGRDPSATKVIDVMSPGVTYCFENQETDEAAKLMADNQVRRLIVLNQHKRLVGVMSLGDLAARARSKEAATHALENVSKPAR